MSEFTYDWPKALTEWLWAFCFGPNNQTHRTCIDAKSWYHAFQANEKHTAEEKLLLKHAETGLEAINKAIENSDKFGEWQHTVSAALAGAMLVSESKVALTPFWKIVAVIVFALLMLIVIWARFPRSISVPVTTRQALDQWPVEPQPIVWLASSIHCTMIEREALLKWKRQRLASAALLMVAGIFCWLLAVTTAVAVAVAVPAAG